MPKFWFACSVLLGLAAAGYAPSLLAARVSRDRTPPPATQAPTPQPASAPVPAPKLPAMTAAQIAERNAAARGGLAAWRAVKSMTLSGRLDAGGKKPTELPFTLEVKRPRMERLAIEFAGHTSLQVFDGHNGWKYRPDLGRTAPEPFSPEEQRKSAGQQELDGLLIDYAAKGGTLALEGTELVEGKGTYRLKLTTRDGVAHHICVDASTFLEAKIEGSPRRVDGKPRRVETYLSDYRTVDGLVLPFVSETRVDGVRAAHRMTIDKVLVNPALEDAEFTLAQRVAAALPAAQHP